mmetsp:Transcript_78781/g.238951  ORF Transcript_78781/g.238951 Transcript_78781/m.238951 type:complete len:257 (+) Transcript_78781:89-859(+)
MMAAAGMRARKQQRPAADLSDVPELMPSAWHRAAPGARFNFGLGCQRLQQQVTAECREAAAAQQVPVADDPGGGGLAAMFPALDASLVQSLTAEARSLPAAIDMLLALTAALAEPGTAAGAAGATDSGRGIGAEDPAEFPSLGGGSGVQLPAHQCPERSTEAEERPGGTWRDRAQAAAVLPAATPRPRPLAPAPAGRREPAAARRGEAEEAEDAEVETDYDLRHRDGQQRARQRARHGRGVGCEHGRLDVAAATGS